MKNAFGVLISGNGSNLQALMDSPQIKINVVISASQKAHGILRARRSGMPVEIVPRGLGEEWILNTLKKYRVKNLFLAGYMRILSEDFILKFHKMTGGQILNIHPSLLPKYKGLKALERALENGDKTLGVTVHHVVPAVDEGPLLMKRSFPAQPSLKQSKLHLHIHEQYLLKYMLKGKRL